jgi:hypothetical protein
VVHLGPQNKGEGSGADPGARRTGVHCAVRCSVPVAFEGHGMREGKQTRTRARVEGMALLACVGVAKNHSWVLVLGDSDC